MSFPYAYYFPIQQASVIIPTRYSCFLRHENLTINSENLNFRS